MASVSLAPICTQSPLGVEVMLHPKATFPRSWDMLVLQLSQRTSHFWVLNGEDVSQVRKLEQSTVNVLVITTGIDGVQLERTIRANGNSQIGVRNIPKEKLVFADEGEQK